MFDEHGTDETPTNPLAEELRSRIPEPGPDYWAAIDARLEQLEQEAVSADDGTPPVVLHAVAEDPEIPSTPGEAAAPLMRLTSMNNDQPFQIDNASVPDDATTRVSPRRRLLLAAAACTALFAGVAGVVAANNGDDRRDVAVDAADAPADSSTSTAPATSTPTTDAAPTTSVVSPSSLIPATPDDGADIEANPSTTTPAPAETTATTAPPTTAPPTTSAPTTTAAPEPEVRTMPNLIGQPVDNANAAISAACGVDVIAMPSPAWDPANPVPVDTIMATWPSAGGTIVPGDDNCWTTNGSTITVFYANPSFCAGPDDPIGLGYCPVGGGTPPEEPVDEPVDDEPVVQVFTDHVMPNVAGAASVDAAVAQIAAACGLPTVYVFTSSAVAEEGQAVGSVVGSLPAAGSTIQSNGSDCAIASGGEWVDVITLVVAVAPEE